MERTNVGSVKEAILVQLEKSYGCTVNEATPEQLFNAVALTLRDGIMEKFRASRSARHSRQSKRIYYLSVEFLMGRAMRNNMLALGCMQTYADALGGLGIDIEQVLDEERDPGLGNGGLGRLAACFLDSLATLDLPAMGCTIRYEYGLFRQRIIDGQQVELPDSWLDVSQSCVWEIPSVHDQFEVRFGGHVDLVDEGRRTRHVLRDYETVLAVPYDYPVVGSGNDDVVPLRMWSARAPHRINMAYFNAGEYARATDERDLAEAISKVLYPEDTHYNGRELRLKQHYFFTSASVQYAVSSYKKHISGDLHGLPDKVVLHINDTHPGLAVPELMRILIDEENLSWDDALSIVRRTCAYTNHTVMAEALERWPEEMISHVLPRIYELLKDLNEWWCRGLWESFPGQWERIGQMAILSYGQVHMANLLCALCFSVNGVSQLHAEILKKETFHDFYLVAPNKFRGITNGITHRRWLIGCNPELTSLIDECIGPDWRREPERMREFARFAGDASVREKFAQIKRDNKAAFSGWLRGYQGDLIAPDFLLDAQAKRLHEYKRQLLNVLHMLGLYLKIRDDASFSMPPRTILFGAKSAPGYRRAKLIIQLINAANRLVNADPKASKLLHGVFLENYAVSPAEKLIPAVELSEQLSTAGKEASGTGNMKFMMNGALTIGTMDGANIEIFERVGKENMYIFGMTAKEVADSERGGYRSGEIFEQNEDIRRTLNLLIDGTLGDKGLYSDLYHSLLFDNYGGMADPYFVLKDFRDFERAQAQVSRDYEDAEKWNRMAIRNTAESGYFSSDRTIAQYNREIWHAPLLFPEA